MTARLISLANADEWAFAVRRMPHGPAHTHWYNAALAAGGQYEIVLFDYADGANLAICPIVLRRYGTSLDIATPYGFGGFATRGSCTGLPDAFRRFASAQGWVCGYLALHPLFAHPFGAADGLELGRTVYVLELANSEEFLLAAMHDTHRYELRRSAKLLETTTAEPSLLCDALRSLYPETLQRVDASDTYHFPEATLGAWLSSPGCLALGLGEPPEAVVLCLYTQDVADYFIFASTRQGRSRTRSLIWRAARELKLRGVRFFNIGGGARELDGLDAFKRRFGGRARSVPVLKQVYDRELFEAFCLRGGSERVSGYFPPYRPPGSAGS